MAFTEISALSDLCLKNVAVNVVPHAMNFNEIQLGCEVYKRYMVFQYLFSDAILRELKYIYLNATTDGIECSSHLKKLLDFLFRGKMRSTSRILRPCVRFLFHENTNEVTLRSPYPYPSAMDVPTLFLEALSLCKNLRCLTLQLCKFPEQRLLQSTNWSSLVKLDLLLSSCNDFIIVHALENCPDIRVLKATGRHITDKCLFYLCKEEQETNNDSFRFCKAEGKCCSLGKKLEKIVFYGTKITECGIACALQHLPLMREFLDGPMGRLDDNSHHVAHAVSVLRRACRLHKRPTPTLRLTTMVYDRLATQNILDDVHEYCPFIDTEAFCPDRDISHLRCQTTSTLALTEAPYRGLKTSFESVISLIQREPVKNLSIVGYIGFPVYDVRSVHAFVDPSLNAEYLQHVRIVNVYRHDDSLKCFITRLLSKAVNVKSLALHAVYAEYCFMDAKKKNKFNSLEEISIGYADLDMISVKDLIKRRTNLKKITFYNCHNEEWFVTRHMSYARKNNFHLNICVAEIDICSFTAIKFHLT